MKILTGHQIKDADRATLEAEAIESLELMERAAEALSVELCKLYGQDAAYLFVAGKGNNGGDALAMARILRNAGIDCSVYLAYSVAELSEECLANLERLPDSVKRIDGLSEADDVDVIVDGLVGAGIKGRPDQKTSEIIKHINDAGLPVVSIDLPSGMGTEFGNDHPDIVSADVTLTIQFPKLAMLLPEAGERCGEIITVDIGLCSDFVKQLPSKYYLTDPELINSFKKNRLKFSHKGNYGHLLLICGSINMPGAALLAASGALRSGCGLLTAHIPGKNRNAMAVSHPSAILNIDENESCFSKTPGDLKKFDVVGIGCGIGQAEQTMKAFEEFLDNYDKSVVFDADALNIMAAHPHLLEKIPVNSVLTPHPGEFARLCGDWDSELEKLEFLSKLAQSTRSVVVLKGNHTAVCEPEAGNIYFNSTGTPALAKGGTGDILTGLIAGLMARGYCGLEASLMGVWLHGRAGEKAADYYGAESMNSSDLPDFIPEAFAELE